MTTLRFRTAARRELVSIARYIAVRNPDRARTFTVEIEAKCRGLVDFPESGPPRDDIARGLRQRVHGNYLILHRYEKAVDRVQQFSM